MCDLASEEILWLFIFRAHCNCSTQTILFVGICYFTNKLMMECTKQWISKHIINIIINNFRSISELYFLKSTTIKIDRIEICFDRYRCITKPFVWTAPWSIHEHVWNWWFMANLFNIHLSAIGKRCLICFSQNRVKGFLECMTRIYVWYWSYYNMLHSLQWILAISGCI